MTKILVSPVAFNEKGKIHSVIERFLKSPAYGKVDYLIVDDASTDGTHEIIQQYASKGVATIRHQSQQGVGATIKTAITHALDNGYEILVIMAGNDKDNPDEIPLLIKPIMEGASDFVQGSRYLRKNQHFGAMPAYRRIATRLHPWLVSLATGKKVTDSTNGFRSMRVELFKDKKINWQQNWLNAYELEPYVLFKVLVLGYRYQEAPVTKIYPAKNLGYTKMRPILGWWSILRPVVLLALRLKH